MEKREVFYTLRAKFLDDGSVSENVYEALFDRMVSCMEELTDKFDIEMISKPRLNLSNQDHK